MRKSSWGGGTWSGRGFVAVACIALSSVWSCKSKDEDNACLESWSKTGGGEHVSDCMCAEWSGQGGRPSDTSSTRYVVVDECRAEMVKVNGPDPDGYGAERLECCAKYGNCRCERESNHHCSGETTLPVCTTGSNGGGSTSSTSSSGGSTSSTSSSSGSSGSVKCPNGTGNCSSSYNHCACGATCIRNSAATGSLYECHYDCTTDADCVGVYKQAAKCVPYTSVEGKGMECK